MMSLDEHRAFLAADLATPAEEAVAGAREEDEEPCPLCGQRDLGQTGEYPCQSCGLPMLHDEATEEAENAALVERILAMSPEDVTAELRAEGIDEATMDAAHAEMHRRFAETRAAEAIP